MWGNRQFIAFGVALAVTVAGTAVLGADSPLASYVGGATMAVAAMVASGREPLPLPFWLGIGTLAWLTVRTAATGNAWIAGPELAAMVGIAGAFATGYRCGTRRRTARRAARLTTITLLILAILAFIAHVSAPDTLLGRHKPFHQDRLTGTFLSANTAATLCGLGLVLGLARLAEIARGADGAVPVGEAIARRGVAAAGLTLFAATCLLLTGSRAGILASLCGGVVAVGGVRATRPGRLLVVAVTGVTAVLLLSSGGVLGDRLADVGTGASGRGALWQASLAAWREAPLFGHGLGSFQRALAPQVTLETAPVLGVQGAAHNLALQWLVQTGVVGTILGGTTLLALFRTLTARHRGDNRWIQRAGIAALLVFALHGLVDYAFEVPAAGWWLALLCGLAAGTLAGDATRAASGKVETGFP